MEDWTFQAVSSFGSHSNIWINSHLLSSSFGSHWNISSSVPTLNSLNIALIQKKPACILNSYFNECFNHTAPLISLKYSALAQCMSDTTLFLVSLNFAKWSGLPDFLALLNSVFRHLIDFTRFLFNQGKLWRRGGSTLLGMLSSIIELFHFTQQLGLSQNFENNSYRWKWNQLCWKESHDENKIDKRLKPDKAGKQQKLDSLRSNFTN